MQQQHILEHLWMAGHILLVSVKISILIEKIFKVFPLKINILIYQYPLHPSQPPYQIADLSFMPLRLPIRIGGGSGQLPGHPISIIVDNYLYAEFNLSSVKFCWEKFNKYVHLFQFIIEHFNIDVCLDWIQGKARTLIFE